METGLLKTVVVIPVATPPDLGAEPVELALGLQVHQGETVAEAYTSAERLVDACGPAQPWVSLRLSDALGVLDRAGATVLVVDGAEEDMIALDVPAAAAAVRSAEPSDDGRRRGWIGGA